MEDFLRRRKDRYLLIPLWQEASATPLNYVSTAADDELGNIQRAGMRLQHALLQMSSGADVNESHPALAESIGPLRQHSGLERLNCESITPRGQGLARLAAAYHLWPFYSAIYYGYPIYDRRSESALAADGETRVRARQMLCNIQRLLFANSRGTRDFLRAAFDVLTDSELPEYLSGNLRSKWRPESLVQFKPDLCAIDSLAADIVKMQKAAVLMREATMVAHKFAMYGGKNLTKDQLELPSRALRLLGVAQMTLFYNPKPRTAPDARRDLHEVLSGDHSEDVDQLRLMVPFHLEVTGNPQDAADPMAAPFRRLADAIYSCEPSKKPLFLLHRNATIHLLKSGAIRVCDIVSDGKTTCLYLNIKPNEQFPVKGRYWFRDDWYSRFSAEFPDWSEKDWWRDGELDSDGLVNRLFAVGRTGLHENPHASAFWDHLGTHGTFLGSWDELCNWVAARFASEATDHTSEGMNWSGFIMELLLRRNEPLTRTSFFLPLAQTHSEEHELDQFAGGTFLGLERPGIPYEQARFHEIAERMMPLVLALADCCLATMRRRQEEERRSAKGRRNELFNLLKGAEFAGNTEGSMLVGQGPPFRFKDYPHNWVNDLATQERLPLLTELSSWDRHFSLPIGQKCWQTLKALFYIFEGTCPQQSVQLRWPDPTASCIDNQYSYNQVLCGKCLDAVLRALVTPPKPKQLPTLIFNSVRPFLPSKPGIRFIVAVADFVNTISTGEEEADWLQAIELREDRVILTWDSDKIPDAMERALSRGNYHCGSAEFVKIPAGTITIPASVPPCIADVLGSPHYYCATVVPKYEDNQIILKWKVKSTAR